MRGCSGEELPTGCVLPSYDCPATSFYDHHLYHVGPHLPPYQPVGKCFAMGNDKVRCAWGCLPLLLHVGGVLDAGAPGCGSGQTTACGPLPSAFALALKYGIPEVLSAIIATGVEVSSSWDSLMHTVVKGT